MQAGALEIVMFTNIARLQKDMASSTRIVTSAVDTMNKVLGTIGVGFSAHMVLAKVDSVTDGMAKLQDVSEKTGDSVEELSKLQFFAGAGGSNIESVSAAIGKLSTNMVSVSNEGAAATQALKFLGLSAKDENGNLKTGGALYREIATELAQYTAGSGKNAIARALMGKAGADQIPVMEKMIAIGNIEASVTKEQAEQAEKYQIEVAKLTRQKEILWNQVVSALIPSMESFVKVMLEASKETGSLGGTAKGLAADGSITDWADKGVMAIAALIDGLKLIPGILTAISGSFKVVAADINVMQKGLVLTNPIASLAEVAKGNNPLAEFKAALAQRNQILEDANKGYEAAFGKELDVTQKAMEKMIAARKANAQDVARDAEGSSSPGGGKGKILNFALGDAAKIAAELKLYQNALQALEMELGKLTGTTQVEKTQYQILEGSLKTLTATHKAYLLLVAAQVDKAQELRFVTDYTVALTKQVDEQERQVTLVGKTAFEQELLNVQNKNAVELKQKLYEEERRIGPLSLALIDKMTLATQQATEKQIAAIKARREAERDWATGAKSALDDYIDHATNAAEQAKMLFSHAFQGMEDALVSFVKTGKLDFKSLADSIITDLIRIQVRQAMAGVLGSPGAVGIGGAIGKLFGFGGSGSVPATSTPDAFDLSMGVPGYANGTDYVPRTGLALVHQGEAITPAGENSGKFAFNINIDARGADAGAVTRLEASLSRFKRDVVPQVADAVRRGGSARAYIRS